MAREPLSPERVVYGVHPVAELLESRPGEVERLWIDRAAGARVGRLARLAREAGVPVSHVGREMIARRAGGRAIHQGVVAQVASARYADADGVARRAIAPGAGPLILVDGVTDAGNLGAILRTSAAAGVSGVLLSSEATCGLTSHVAKASAGALERLSVAREAHPPRRLRWLAERGLRPVALDPRGGQAWDRVDWRGAFCLVAGGEERGPRPGVLAACAARVAIPLAAGVESLNVAVAVGVLLFEALRQRRSFGNGS